ncbi:MAG: hypothetical protein ABWY53_07185 [Leifsonia flava]
MGAESDEGGSAEAEAASRKSLRARGAAAVGRTESGRLLLRCIHALADFEIFDRSMTLAAHAFTSIIPILIAVVALNSGGRGALGRRLADNLGLGDAGSRVLEGAIPSSTYVLGGIGWFGLLLLVIAATAFSRALERFFVRLWSTHKAPLRFAWRWLLALAAVVVGVLVLEYTRAVLRPNPTTAVLDVLVEAIIWSAVWIVTPWLVLNRAVAWRMLLPGAVLSGIGLALAGLVARVYLPIALTEAAREFGALGMAFSYLGWIFVLMFVMVIASTVGHVIATDDGPLGRRIRGRER